MKVYTLPVIDEDGSVTGKPGTVLVGERELEYREVNDLSELRIGEAARLSVFNAPLFVLVLSDGGKFHKTPFRYKGATIPFLAWERVA